MDLPEILEGNKLTVDYRSTPGDVEYILISKCKKKTSPQKNFHNIIVPETNRVPEIGPSQKDIHFSTIHFQGQSVSFREGNRPRHAKDAPLWQIS